MGRGDGATRITRGWFFLFLTKSNKENITDTALLRIIKTSCEYMGSCEYI